MGDKVKRLDEKKLDDKCDVSIYLMLALCACVISMDLRSYSNNNKTVPSNPRRILEV